MKKQEFLSLGAGELSCLQRAPRAKENRDPINRRGTS